MIFPSPKQALQRHLGARPALPRRSRPRLPRYTAVLTCVGTRANPRADRGSPLRMPAPRPTAGGFTSQGETLGGEPCEKENDFRKPKKLNLEHTPPTL